MMLLDLLTELVNEKENCIITLDININSEPGKTELGYWSKMTIDIFDHTSFKHEWIVHIIL